MEGRAVRPAFQAGAADYVSKPFSAAELAARRLALLAAAKTIAALVARVRRLALAALSYSWNRTLCMYWPVKFAPILQAGISFHFQQLPWFSMRADLNRRLINLLFVGWLPPDLTSSRSCLCLAARAGLPEASASWCPRGFS